MSADPRRQALLRALVERDLYALLGVPPTATQDEVAMAIDARRAELAAPGVHPQTRRVEGHWLDWADRALVRDPDLRAEYDAALREQAERQRTERDDRERRRRLEHEVRRRRDEVARREELRAAAHIERPATPKRGAASGTASRAARPAARPSHASRLRAAREQAAELTGIDDALAALDVAADADDLEGVTAAGERALMLRGDLPTLMAVAAAHRRVGDIGPALAALREATRLQPDPAADHRPWTTMVAVLRQRGDLADARETAQRVVDADPSLGLAWNLLGTVLADLGRDEEAERALAQAIELGPQRSAPMARLRALRDQHEQAGDAAGVARVDAHLSRLGLA